MYNITRGDKMGILQTRKIAEISLDEESKLKGIAIYCVITLKFAVENREVVVRRKTLERDIYVVHQSGEYSNNLDEKEKAMMKEVNDIVKELDAYEKIFEQLKERGYEIEFDDDC